MFTSGRLNTLRNNTEGHHVGVETDYIAVEDSQIDKIWELIDTDDLKGVYGKGSDPISLSMLHCCISGDEFDMEMADQFQEMSSANGGDRFLLEIPTHIRDSIDQINPYNVKDIVSKWSQTAEYELTGWDDDIAIEFLTCLSDYSRTNAAKKLLMCMSV